MKNRILSIIALVLLSQLGYAQAYKIEITVEGISDSIAYLGYHFGDQKYVRDTAKVKNGLAVFEGETPLDQGVYFFYTPSAYFEVLPDQQFFSLTTKAPDFIFNMEIENSVENTLFNNLQKFTVTRQRKAQELSDQIKSETDETKVNEMREEMASISKEVNAYQSKLIAENSQSFVAKLVGAMQSVEVPENIGAEDPQQANLQKYHYFKTHFFDNLDVSDAGLLRTPVYHPKVMEYLDKVLVQQPDTVINAIDQILSKATGDETVFRYLLVTLANKYEISQTMGMDKVFVHLIDNYYLTGQAQWADEELLSKLRERSNAIRPNLIGSIAPSITLVDTLEAPISLKEINSRFTVLYFYDPECGHCKKKTPVLNDAYPQLQAKGVEVVAVNVTTDMKKWKEYIRENDLNWINGADPHVRSNFRYEYDIRSTPTVYLLDQEKRIIAKRIDVEDIENIVDQYLKIEGGKP